MSIGVDASASPFSDRLKDEAVRRSFMLWRRLWRAIRSTPSWNRFDPSLLADALAQLEIHERLPSGRLESRQAWAPGVERIARGIGRLHFDERIGPDAYEARRRVFDACLDGGMPMVYRDVIATSDTEMRMFRRLLLPFRDDSDRPNLLLSHVIVVPIARDATRDPRRHELHVCSVADLEAAA